MRNKIHPFIFPMLVLLIGATYSNAQISKLSGTVIDSSGRAPIFGVNLILTSLADSAVKRFSTTGGDGGFVFTEIAKGQYRLKASYVGYRDIQKDANVQDTAYRFGTLIMAQRPVLMKGVEVTGDVVPVEQKKDTVQFNAGAFKTNRDASAEDLVTKLPGVTVDKTTIKAQGEDVKQVLVDGKPFFGDDPFVALRNMPAEVIEKIQVYDKLSDQAELTGFDDGQTTKTMNVITRGSQRNSQFGKLYGGYGENKRYEAGGNISMLGGNRRISLIGISNNINQQNFSSQDILGISGGGRGNRGGFDFRAGGRGGGERGGGGRGGGERGSGMPMMGGNLSDFVVGQQNGVNTTHSAGVNYSNLLFEKMNLTGSYFFNASNNDNTQSSDREYLSTSDQQRSYSEENITTSENFNHRINMRIEYPIDSANSLIATPRISFQKNNSGSITDGSTYFDNTRSGNQSITNNSSDGDGYNFSQGLTFRHRFPSEGRTVSVDLNTSLNSRTSLGGTKNLSEFIADSTSLYDTLDQRSNGLTKGYSVSSNVMFTEQLAKDGLLQASYNVSLSNSDAEKRAYDFNPSDQEYDLIKPDLSTVLNNKYITHRGGLGYRMRGTDYNGTIGFSYQNATLKADYTYPDNRSLRKIYESILPTAMLNWKLSQASNLRIFYRTSTSPPSINQLQDVVDNSNPTLLTAGNSGLRQNYNHTVMARYNYTNVENSTTFFAMLGGTLTKDYVGNAIFVAESDTTLPSGIQLKPGTQLTVPMNMDSYRNLNSFFTYGVPLAFVKCNLNLNTGLGYGQTPGLINDRKNISRTYSLSQGLIVSSNISSDLDFSASYNYNINYNKNSLRSDLNTNYYQHTIGLKLNWTFWEGVVLRSDLNQQLYSGYGSQSKEEITLWNVGAGKKFLADDRAELSVKIFDVLNRNAKIIRNVTESYIESVHPTVLGRYFILTFTYTIRNYQM